VSGVNQVDLHILARLAGEPVIKADADFVRAATGFAIGGIPPLGHTRRLRTIIDRDLLTWPTVWAAAGTPHAVFALPAAALGALTDGEIEDVRSA
jgi:prolyl-tRNA editing enzyme YbaK/EbsC (Cys-tRNA(Pro) deacylase)